MPPSAGREVFDQRGLADARLAGDTDYRALPGAGPGLMQTVFKASAIGHERGLASADAFAVIAPHELEQQVGAARDHAIGHEPAGVHAAAAMLVPRPHLIGRPPG